MQFNVEEIKIMISPNLKNQAPVEFTRSMLYHPELKEGEFTLNQHPYFTFDVQYPLDVLRYLDYQDRVEFFFNKEKFTERLSAYVKDILVEKTDPTYYSKRDANIKENIMTMLEILLPTKFPVINDLHESIDTVLQRASFGKRMFINPVVTKHFSYVKLGGQTYTVKKVVWLNDLLNHPEYRRLLDNYRKFIIWAGEERGRWEEATNKALIKTREIVDKLFFKLDPFFGNGKCQETSSANGVLLLRATKLVSFLLSKTKANNDKVGTFVPNEQSATIEFLESDKRDIELESALKQLDGDNIAYAIGSLIKENLYNKYSNIQLLYYILNRLSKNYKLQTQADEKSVDKNFPLKLTSNMFPASGKPGMQLSEINALIEQLSNNRLAVPLQKLNDIQSMFEQPFAVLEKSKDMQLPPEYRNFAYTTLKLFQRPQRETTNQELQNLINGFDENSVTQFFKAFQTIYSHYMRGTREETAAEQKQVEHLLEVGLGYINTNILDRGQRREIYVMIDFIEGEVTDKDVGNIFCPFVGDHLGNEFRFLMRMLQYGKVGSADTNYWNVMRNRMLFSIKTVKSSAVLAKGKKQEMVGKLLPGAANVGLGNIRTERQQTAAISSEVSKQHDAELAAWFFNEIMKPGDAELNKYIREVEKYGVYRLDLYDIFAFIHKNAPDLYRLIEKWHSNKFEYNSDVKADLVRMETKYDGEIKVKEALASEDKTKSDSQKLNIIKSDIALYSIYKLITKALNEHESKKTQRISFGGYKKRATQKSKNKRRQLSRKYKTLTY